MVRGVSIWLQSKLLLAKLKRCGRKADLMGVPLAYLGLWPLPGPYYWSCLGTSLLTFIWGGIGFQSMFPTEATMKYVPNYQDPPSFLVPKDLFWFCCLLLFWETRVLQGITGFFGGRGIERRLEAIKAVCLPRFLSQNQCTSEIMELRTWSQSAVPLSPWEPSLHETRWSQLQPGHSAQPQNMASYLKIMAIHYCQHFPKKLS